MLKRISITLLFLVSASLTNHAQDKIAFWDNYPRRGCNNFNETPDEQWFKDAASINIEWVRLAYDKWDSEKRDFLIGDASNYTELIKNDLEKLKEVLSWAEKYNLKVVITPLSLPGCRWSQNNGDKQDLRLWEDFLYQEQAIHFWVDLAKELKDHSCIVAYDILNEPHPELRTNIEEQTVVGDAERFIGWYEKYKGTPRDLYQFYQRIIKAIREVDPETPIMVESGFYAQPPAYMEWPGIPDDDKILYSFHMYEPYSFTSGANFRNGGKYSYPGDIEFGNSIVLWDKNTMNRYFEPFYRWAEKNSIPINRIVAAEFGCMRRNEGAGQYLEDVITILEDRKYHWAFYSYREDEWDGYDYELGTKGLPWEYWKAKDRGEKPGVPRMDNPLFDIIKKRLENKQPE
jgi:hypothetical protein